MTDVPAGSYGGRALRGASLAIVGFAGAQGLNLVAYIVLANLVSPEDFGVFAAGGALLALGMLLAESGMHAALVQRRDDVEHAANTAFVATIMAGALLAGVALASHPLWGWALGDERVGQVVAVLAGCFLIRAVMVVPDALLQRRFSFVRRLFVEPLGVLAFAIVSVWACARGAGVWGLVAGTYSSLTVQTIAAWGFARWRPRPRLASMAVWRELIGYGRNLTFAELIRRTASQLDVLIVGAVAGVAGAGQYRNGVRLASTPLQAWVSVGAYALFPTFARLDPDRDRMRRAVLRALRWMCVGGFPLSLLLFAQGPYLASALLGPRWTQAGLVIVALGLYPAGQMLVSLFSEVVKATGDTSLMLKVHSGALALLLPLAFAGAAIWGTVGAAAALSVVSIASAAYATALMSRVLEMDVRCIGREIRAPALAASAMAALVLALDSVLVAGGVDGRLTAGGLLVGESLGGLLAYFAFLRLLAPNLVRDLRDEARVMRRSVRSTARVTVAAA